MTKRILTNSDKPFYAALHGMDFADRALRNLHSAYSKFSADYLRSSKAASQALAIGLASS